MRTVLASTIVIALGCTAFASPVSFRGDVIPLLTRLGCNSGTCHGSPAGKNGFRLSLRGYDPAADHAALTRENSGRRIDCLRPAQSLFLAKPSLQVSHEGGRRLEAGSMSYRTLHEWVEDGARDDGPGFVAPASIEVLPAEALIEGPPWQQDLVVKARWSSGGDRDVTHLAAFRATDAERGAVSADGRVHASKRGELVVVAEYLGLLAASRILAVDREPPVAWDAPEPASFIDEIVFAKLRRLRIVPSRLSTDEEFLRRVHLDATGVLPAPEEARRFLADPDREKRARLIDDLLERPEFAQFWTMRWADRLGVNQRFVGKQGAYKFHDWLRRAIGANLPEDTLVRAVLTASGGSYGSPAVGFWRRLRDPESAVEEVAQLFLGVRIGCARCHNHPADRWSRDDFLGLAAFFAQVRFKDGPFFNHLYDKEETLFIDPAGELQHPRLGQSVKPRFLDGQLPTGSGGDRRVDLARWLTAPENPFFARAAANRIWFHLFGRGIVEPPDDFSASNPPSNEALLEALAADFAAHGFDRKRLIRRILSSRTYQLSSVPNAFNADDDVHFSHARERLLEAEQLLDAISAAAGVPEGFAGMPVGARAAELPDGEYEHAFLAAFGRPARAMACECERDRNTNLLQGLALAGGETLHAKLRSDSGRAARLAATSLPPEAIVEELFLATLSRFPRPAEREAMARRLAAAPDRRRAVEDLLWALVNHREFLFQH
jgi:hypothetical protein